ncbi:MAG: efflux RND transporter periplasmic adaptor subunit [Opitutaceae bacterium]|nr:efflux RND transporter periplasmic adaptor subunit [Opitutaceae bacterium]
MPFPSRRRRAWGILVTILLSAGCSRSSRQAAAPAPGATLQPVEVVAVSKRDLTDAINLVGSVAANESAQIRAEIAGQIREILFNEGERVSRGQILLKIDDSELAAQVAQAVAAFRLAELNFDRAQNLAKSNLITQADTDGARSEYLSAKAALALLRIRLAKTELKAPFAGVTGARSVSLGDYVNSSTAAIPITTINDLSRMKIEFQVPERFLDEVKPGSTFRVQARSADQAAMIAGEVYFVSAVIDRATRSSEVKGYLLNPPEQIKPGMFANVELVLNVHQGVLTVPEGAILVTPRGPQIIAVVEKDGVATADFVPVNLGLRARGLVEIEPVDKQRLKEGQPVVAAGVGALILYQGAKLEPRPQRREFSIGN